MEQLIKIIEENFNTRVIEKINMINVIVIKFENGMKIDFPKWDENRFPGKTDNRLHLKDQK